MLKLNPQQQQAIVYTDGPLLVLAGAGSGKTRVITQKIVHLITEMEIKAYHITALTFTNKAAREMKERVGQVLERKQKRGLTISTFHNLGLTILRKEIDSAGLKAGFSIFDDQDTLNLMRSLLNKNAYKDKETLMQIQSCISNWKNAFMLPESVILDDDDKVKTAAKHIYAQYQAALQAYNAVDFDDLILRPVQMFKRDRDSLTRWQAKIRYLLIDEYQDTNASQYEMVKLLTRDRGAFTVVGDDDQSIYAWRGAQPENLNLLQEDFPSLHVIKLEQNYRSSACILKSANTLIANNPHLFEKKLWSELGYGQQLRVIATKDEFDEAEQVAAEIISHKLQSNTNFGDYAILYRGNHQSRVFEKALRQQQIPYQISGGQSFFARTEIKDIVAYLRVLGNPDDDNAFLRIINTPRRGIGASTLTKLGEFATQRGISLFAASTTLAIQQHISAKAAQRLQEFADWARDVAQKCEQEEPIRILKEMIEDINYEGWLHDQCDSSTIAEKKMANVWDLLTWIEKMLAKKAEESSGMSDVINHLMLLDILDRNENEQLDQVQLMTFHASKGLEFPHVYMVGMEEDLLPHRTSIEEENIEEERRLAYVGITRAQKTLCFTLAQKRRRYGETVECQPSRFLEEIPENDVVWSGMSRSGDGEQTARCAKTELAGLRSLLSQPVPLADD